MYDVLLADNDPQSLGLLETAVKCIPEASVVAKVTNGGEVLALLTGMKPDIAIVDAEMTTRGGQKIVQALRAATGKTVFIFVSSSEKHAVEAFEKEAVDYLIKPVSFERLRESLRRAQRRLFAEASNERFAELQLELSAQKTAANDSYHRELWVRDRRGLTRIPTADVDYIEAAGDYVMAHLGDRTQLVNESIASLAAKLDPKEFLRIHRCSIVKVAKIRSLARRGPRNFAVILANGTQKAIGPTYCEAVLQALQAKRWR